MGSLGGSENMRYTNDFVDYENTSGQVNGGVWQLLDEEWLIGDDCFILNIQY